MEISSQITDLLEKVRSDPQAATALKQKASELQEKISAASVLQTDRLIYRSVVIVLGITILSTVIGGLMLAFKGDPNYKLPAEIVAIGSAAVGALAGLLAPSPQSK